ncbi:MAG: divalent-cation tolerance protein CutA [Kiritimatiellales bacterium]|nr:divalent-cation tolerance protein CutA [Kiritimatiellales bacterium]
MATDAYLVYVTAANRAEAERIAVTVVEERLAACANLLGDIESIYWWEGKVCREQEVAFVLKTTDGCREQLVERIRQLHSYDTPAIVCLPISSGNPDFLRWVAAETKE